MDDGVIKFDINWQKGASPEFASIIELIYWRDRMYELGLIGFDKKYQVGYGNISCKVSREKSFVISGTQTGHISKLGSEYYTLVTDYNIQRNSLFCKGPVKASSESLTHAAIYEANEAIQCIIHIHHDEQWKKLLHSVPTTDGKVAYGTPEMAFEIKRLFEMENMKSGALIAMAGHQGGLLSFGANFKEAVAPYLKLFGSAD